MPEIYRTDQLDEAIDIVQDPTKVISKTRDISIRKIFRFSSSAISIYSTEIRHWSMSREMDE